MSDTLVDRLRKEANDLDGYTYASLLRVAADNIETLEQLVRDLYRHHLCSGRCDLCERVRLAGLNPPRAPI
jgi:methyl coenzyme M reductase subunit C-like uncharacterized protein (methanogenesis marker protein 7)